MSIHYVKKEHYRPTFSVITDVLWRVCDKSSVIRILQTRLSPSVIRI
jgi:hypothetical protein